MHAIRLTKSPYLLCPNFVSLENVQNLNNLAVLRLVHTTSKRNSHTKLTISRLIDSFPSNCMCMLHDDDVEKDFLRFTFGFR